MPRKKRSITTQRKWSKLAPAVLCRESKRRSEKHKTWSDDSMKAALKAVEDGQFVSGAARDYGIPKTTFFDRVNGRFDSWSKKKRKKQRRRSRRRRKGKKRRERRNGNGKLKRKLGRQKRGKKKSKRWRKKLAKQKRNLGKQQKGKDWYETKSQT